MTTEEIRAMAREVAAIKVEPAEPLTDDEIANLLEGALDGFTIKGKVTVRLLDEVTRARALLRRIEWEARDDRFESAICPECHGLSDHSEAVAIGEPAGHKPGCDLAALIGKAQ